FFRIASPILFTPDPSVGAGLLAKRSVCHTDVECATAIAGKPGFHRVGIHLFVVGTCPCFP
ncbi:hypothetical protein, partial [Pseudomonas corrugata]|uniref:hypothetical protein n=1 Tax=Pseudomonas corrugata TaxID=47879 RepID=UPI001C2F8915